MLVKINVKYRINTLIRVGEVGDFSPLFFNLRNNQHIVELYETAAYGGGGKAAISLEDGSIAPFPSKFGNESSSNLKDLA